VNYSIPRELDSYVHRIGRTGRSGKKGVAMSLVTGSQRYLIGKVERMTKSKMKEGRVPSRKDIAAKKVTQSLALFQNQPDYGRAVQLMDPAWREALFDMPAEEIAGRFLAMLHSDLIQKGPDPAEQAQQQREKPSLPKLNDSRRPEHKGYRSKHGGGEYADAPKAAPWREKKFGYGKKPRPHRDGPNPRGPISRGDDDGGAPQNPWRPMTKAMTGATRLPLPVVNSGR
jgi:superfamily II DNA/RNA helicase